MYGHDSEARPGDGNPRITRLPIERRRMAFERAISMKAENFRPVEIFERLQSIGLPINYDTILSWVNQIRNPAKKLNLVKHFDGNLVELVGMTIGDGTWRRILKGESYESGRVRYASNDFELVTKAGQLVAAVMGRRNPYRPYWSKTNRVYLVECGSKQLVEILYDAMNSLENLIWRHRIRFLKGTYNAE
jgi:hypothetical protein